MRNSMVPNQVIRRTARPTGESDETGMGFGHAHAVLARDRGFHGLNPLQRRVLSRWLAAAQPAGIDAAEDLAERPWPGAAAESIIGVFKAGHLLASWLVVGQGGTWAVACCADGAVSPSFDDLAEALALICPVEETIRPS